MGFKLASIVFVTASFALILIFSSVPASCAGTSWISSYSFQGANQPFNGTALAAGTVYNLTLIVNVPPLPQGAANNFSINLSTFALGASSVKPIWYLENNYAGVTQKTRSMLYSSSISFEAVQGTLKVGAVFMLSSSAISTTTIYGGKSVTITVPENLTIVQVFWGGVQEGSISYQAINAQVENYLNYRQRLQHKAIPSIYEGIVSSTEDDASSLASEGLYSQADSLLLSLLNQEYSAPPSALPIYGLGAATAIGFALAITFALLYARTRAKGEEYAERVRSIVSELTGVSVQLQKYDRSLSKKVDDLIEKLRGARDEQ
ncbi:MAG: hypothetical protein ACP5T2_04990 [Thermoprotei archaeon]